MQLFVIYEDQTLPIEVNSEGSINDLKISIEIITGIPGNNQVLVYNGNTLPAEGSISSFQIVENDLICMTNISNSNPNNSLNIHDLSSSITPEELIRLISTNPRLQLQLQNTDPDLYELVSQQNIPKVRALMMKRAMLNHKQIFNEKVLQNKIWSNPDSEENQILIAEKIRMENVQANMDVALEVFPEGFGSVTMLYVKVEIHGQAITAFVDSGAQMTIMSSSCAERCGLFRLMDKRFHGEARGVGSAKILGKIHLVEMKFGNSYFPLSISVLDQNEGPEFIIGLDMLKRHHCEISLKDNELRIEGNNGVEREPFIQNIN